MTLRGELIEVQGTISGGGRPKQGGMSAYKKTDYAQSDVSQLEKELQTLQNSLEALRAERSGIQSGSFDFRRRLQAARHDVS